MRVLHPHRKLHCVLSVTVAQEHKKSRCVCISHAHYTLQDLALHVVRELRLLQDVTGCIDPYLNTSREKVGSSSALGEQVDEAAL